MNCGICFLEAWALASHESAALYFSRAALFALMFPKSASSLDYTIDA